MELRETIRSVIETRCFRHLGGCLGSTASSLLRQHSADSKITRSEVFLQGLGGPLFMPVQDTMANPSRLVPDEELGRSLASPFVSPAMYLLFICEEAVTKGHIIELILSAEGHHEIQADRNAGFPDGNTLRAKSVLK